MKQMAIRSVVVVLGVCMTVTAWAELRDVEVGGSIRIRGNYWTSPAGPDQGFMTNPLAGQRWRAQPGRLAVFSPVDWDDKGNGVKFVEQRTKVNVRAEFSDKVSAFVELDNYGMWGNSFRSRYLTGVDARMAGPSAIELYQGYIEVDEAWGHPLRLRIGRQELKFGSGWLVGTNDGGSSFRGLSFDAIRGTYTTDTFTLDAFAAKLVETSPMEEDGDVDFYGLYGSYTGLEGMTLDAYWLLLRDAGALGSPSGPVLGWVEDVFGVNDYDTTTLNTVGVRASGKCGALDFEAELAYQFGEAASVGSTFAGAGLLSPYGDDDADFDVWGANLLVGYTFDKPCSPRIYGGGAYLGGEDNRDLNVAEWFGAMVSPFWEPQASVSFNRLFSDTQYGQFVGSSHHDCTNLWIGFAGIMAQPMERLTLCMTVAYVGSLADYDAPWPTFEIFGNRVTPFSAFSFLDRENDDHICTELDLAFFYSLSDDLMIEGGYSRLFLGDGIEGHFNIFNGLGFSGGTDKDDADYFYLDMKLSF